MAFRTVSDNLLFHHTFGKTSFCFGQEAVKVESAIDKVHCKFSLRIKHKCGSRSERNLSTNQHEHYCPDYHFLELQLLWDLANSFLLYKLDS